MRAALLLGMLGLWPSVVGAAEEPAAAPAQEQKAPAPAPATPPPAAPAPAPAAPAPVAAPAPALPPAAPQPAVAQPNPAAATAGAADPKAAKKGADEDLSEAARVFYLAILDKDVDRLVALCRAPFFFESRTANSEAEVRKKWETSLQSESMESLRVLGIEFFTYDEMLARYGKSPERLGSWPLRSGTFSVANLSGHAVVVLWRKVGAAWQPVGFHD